MANVSRWTSDEESGRFLVELRNCKDRNLIKTLSGSWTRWLLESMRVNFGGRSIDQRLKGYFQNSGFDQNTVRETGER